MGNFFSPRGVDSAAEPRSRRGLLLPLFTSFRRGFPEDSDDAPFLGGLGLEFHTRFGDVPESLPPMPRPPEVSTEPLFSPGTQQQVSSSPSSGPYGYYPAPSTASTTAGSHRVGGRSFATTDSPRSRRRSWLSSSGTASTAGSAFEPVQQWWSSHIAPNVKSWPKLSCRVEPTTTLKIRKKFRPIGTIVRLGADFNTQLGVWQFKSSWEDAFVGGKLTLAGRELQLSKSWQLSVGAVEDLVTRLRFRAAVDLQTWKAYVRVGFRTERLSPINVMEGFTILKQVPLDGNKGHVKLEVKANLSLPEPEIEYSTETQRSLVGMGDIEISVDELNLVLDY